MRILQKLSFALLLVALAAPLALAKNDKACPGKSCDAKKDVGISIDETVTDTGNCPGKSCEAKEKTGVSDDDTLTEVAIAAEAKANVLLNGRNEFKANIRTKHIYYVGETLSVFVKFSRGIELLADGLAEAHIIVVSPNTDAYSFPVDSSIGPNDRKFFSIDIENAETLPLGQYQLGLVATVPGGDPLNIKDWYNGFRGLLDMEGLYISDKSLPEDADGDGECDADSDGDGFCDDQTTDNDDNVDREPLPGEML